MLNRGAACGDSGCRYVGAARREYTNRGFPKDVVGGLGSRFDDLGTAPPLRLISCLPVTAGRRQAGKRRPVTSTDGQSVLATISTALLLRDHKRRQQCCEAEHPQ
ncbi:MAG: hypothetical protein QOF30_1782 [Acidimicrobiaceae bacterium]|nr:hypothetical protein [Acidimicrobiaceae bacterium]